MNTGLIIGIICLALVSIAVVVVIRMNKKTSPTTTSTIGPTSGPTIGPTSRPTVGPTTSTDQDNLFGLNRGVFEKVENEFKNFTL